MNTCQFSHFSCANGGHFGCTFVCALIDSYYQRLYLFYFLRTWCDFCFSNREKLLHERNTFFFKIWIWLCKRASVSCLELSVCSDASSRTCVCQKKINVLFKLYCLLLRGFKIFFTSVGRLHDVIRKTLHGTREKVFVDCLDSTSCKYAGTASAFNVHWSENVK